MCSCCSFISPPGQFSVLFDIRPTRSPDEYKSEVECASESLSVLLCLTRNLHTGPSPFSLSLSNYCSRLIALIKHWAVVRLDESAALFSTSPNHAVWKLPFSAQPGQRANEVTGKMKNKSKTQKYQHEEKKTKFPLEMWQRNTSGCGLIRYVFVMKMAQCGSVKVIRPSCVFNYPKT